MSGKPKEQKAKTNKTAEIERSQTSTTTPWGPAEGALRDITGWATSAFKDSSPFTGDIIAPATQGQRSAVNQIYGAAPSLATGAGDLRSMASLIASGHFLDVNNPVLTAARDSAINPIREQLFESILPSIDDAAIRGGAYGGTAPAIMEGKAAGDFAEAAMRTGAGMNLDWTNQRFGDVFSTPGMFQAANTLELAPGMATMMAGDYERGLNQLPLDNEFQKWQTQQQGTWGPLQNFYNIISGLGGKFGTTTSDATGTESSFGNTTQIGAEPDMMTQILQGGLGGLGVLSSLGTAFPATMGAIGGGSAVAPILAGLGFLSDRRVKEAIEKVGMLDNGLPVYRFKYKGTDAYTIGLMADEVEERMPDAIIEYDGLKYVNYLTATQ